MIPGILASSAAGGGVVPPASVTWNPSDVGAAWSLSGANLVATKTGADAYSSGRASKALTTESGYFEVYITEGGTSPFQQVGVASAAMSLAGSLNNANGWCYYQQDGSKRHNGVNTAMGATWTTGDTIRVAYANGKVWFGKNATWYGDPAAGTGEAFSGIAVPVFPAASLNRGSSPPDKITGRFTSADFAYSPPAGFDPWDEA